MTRFGVIILCMLSFSVKAEQLRLLPSLETEVSSLRIFASADYTSIAPVLIAFQNLYPSIRIYYTEFGTRALYKRFLETHPNNPDLVLSSAMDLQFKLVNDGFAQSYSPQAFAATPDWSRWRNEIFGFTYEPAVIAINNELLAEDPLPKNRAELLDLIRRNSDYVRGRIGTYDITNAGVGYLAWSHDRQQSGTYGRMLESFGAHQTKVFPRSSLMLKALTEGEIMIAYNILGSYAHAWAKTHPEISVILPSDYTALIMRSAFIPKKATNPIDAKRFLDFLLSREGQQILADYSSFYPIHEDVTGETTAKSLRRTTRSPLRPNPLGLPLLIHTDQHSRKTPLEERRRSIGGD